MSSHFYLFRSYTQKKGHDFKFLHQTQKQPKWHKKLVSMTKLKNFLVLHRTFEIDFQYDISYVFGFDCSFVLLLFLWKHLQLQKLEINLRYCMKKTFLNIEMQTCSSERILSLVFEHLCVTCVDSKMTQVDCCLLWVSIL